MAEPFFYGDEQLTPGIALDLVRGRRRGALSAAAEKRMASSRAIVDDVLAQEEIVYGVTTGFGPLCTTFISPREAATLQHRLLMSHAAGMGEPISSELVRLMLVLKVQALARGYSGIQVTTVERILWMLEQDIIPLVPRQGSVGASGDLAPLAHLFLPLLGLGKVRYRGKAYETDELFTQLGISPLQLGPKEGLALINGTQFMVAYGIQILERLQRCLDSADVIAALSLEALAGSARPFHPELHELRPHPGCQYVAQRLRQLLDDSEIMQSHLDCDRVQDPYSLRCIPQVHGASRQAWLHLRQTIDTEINSVTDNPILLSREEIISGGNFHGQPIALPLDYAGLAAAEIGSISERRIYLSLEGKIPGLPPLLMKKTGLNSGFMIPQYTAAALVTENKSLCFPASADSIPTSMGQEDHVSMGSISAPKTLRIVENLEQILAIELLYAAQGLDFRRPLRSSPLLDYCHEQVRIRIAHREKDRPFGPDLESALQMVRSGQLISWIDEAAAAHHINLQNQTHDTFGIY